MTWQGKKVMVVGDYMLDKYIFGEVSRISPEAPVPILNMTTTSNRLGGAGNVAANIVSLGGNVLSVGVVGADKHGIDIYSMIGGIGATVGLKQSSNRKTTVKTRVLSGSHHIVRIDTDDQRDISGDDESFVKETFLKMINNVDAVVISDYCKGVITMDIAKFIIKNASSIPVIVDSKRTSHYDWFSGAYLITPNASEAKNATWFKETNSFLFGPAGFEIRDRFGIKNVVITLGKDGMVLVEENGKTRQFEATSIDVFDVSGAGDTVVAAVSLGIASGLPLPAAVDISNHAAGVVVGKVGTATCSLKELENHLRSSYMKKSNGENQNLHDELKTQTSQSTEKYQ